MPSVTMESEVLGHFLHSTYTLTFLQCTSTFPVWSLTYLSLQAISVAGAGEGGVWGGVGGCRIPQEIGSRWRVELGSAGDRGGAKGYGRVHDSTRRETDMVSYAGIIGRRRRDTEDPQMMEGRIRE